MALMMGCDGDFHPNLLLIGKTLFYVINAIKEDVGQIDSVTIRKKHMDLQQMVDSKYFIIQSH